MDHKDDHLNDETFGGGWTENHEDLMRPHSSQLPSFFQTNEDFLEEPLEDELEDTSQQPLPEFFNNQATEDFLEEPLEDEENSTRDKSFFLEHENEALSRLDTQMESMFKDVLEEDEDPHRTFSHENSPRNHQIPPERQGYPVSPPNYWKTRTQVNQDEIPPRRDVRLSPSNPLDKLFPVVTTNQNNTGGTQVPPKGALSLEELEARFAKGGPPIPEQPQLSSSPITSTHDFSPRSPRSQTGFFPPRPRWRESKQRMTASEIDFVIQTQKQSMYGGPHGANQFIDDYYFELYRSEKTGIKSPHRPLFESFSTTRFTPSLSKKPDPFEGVLGRIPSHSVRAPRPLLQLKSDENENASVDHSVALSSRAEYSRLLTIENAFNNLLDIEDLNDLLQRPEISNHVNINSLQQKREQLTNELFTSLHIYDLPLGNLPNRKVSNDNPFVFPQDRPFIQFMLVRKGRQVIVRSLPLLFQNHVIAIFFAFMRNLTLIVTSTDSENPITSKIFSYLISVAAALPVPQTILSLQTIIAAHTSGYLIHILQSKWGLAILQTLLKHAYDLNLSPFSREEGSIPLNSQHLIQFGVHWRETINALFQLLDQKFKTLVDSIQNQSIWEFLAVFVINLNSQQKRSMLTDLRSFIVSPLDPTIVAFLKLCQ